MVKGVTLWFTGLSGSGKTTITKAIEMELKKKNVPVEILDGDIVRQHLTSDLGFSKEDRQKNIERVAYVAKLLSRNQVVVLASLISPFNSMRQYCRNEINNFVEVYVKCSLEKCMERDVKGLYKKALNGEIKNFTGVSAPFEEPLHPEIILDTEHESIMESTNKVLAYLKEQGYM